MFLLLSMILHQTTQMPMFSHVVQSNPTAKTKTIDLVAN
jgi:hypothetical protein